MSSIDRDTLNAALAPVYAALGTDSAHVVDLYVCPDRVLATIYVAVSGATSPRSLRVIETPEEIGRTSCEAQAAELERLRAKIGRVESVCQNTDGHWLAGEAEIPVGEVLRMLHPDGGRP